MINQNNYYEVGEERFGILTSSFYNLFKLNPTIKRFYDFVLDDLNNFNPKKLLDVGSGTGTILLNYARRHDIEMALGVDPSPYMVRYSNRKAKRMKLSEKVKFVQGSSRYIPGNEKFHIITSSLSFHHWNKRDSSVAYLLGRVHEGGRFVIYEITGHKGFSRRIASSHLMQRDEFESISSELGIDVDVLEKDGFIRAAFVSH